MMDLQLLSIVHISKVDFWFCCIHLLGWDKALSHAFGFENGSCKKHWNCSVSSHLTRWPSLWSTFQLFLTSDKIKENPSFIIAHELFLYLHVAPLFCSYAICGDQTIKKIANTRPSTKARLANVDGVNMVCFDNLSGISLWLFVSLCLFWIVFWKFQLSVTQYTQA